MRKKHPVKKIPLDYSKVQCYLKGKPKIVVDITGENSVLEIYLYVGLPDNQSLHCFQFIIIGI